MNDIVNKPSVTGDEKTDMLRAAIEHRATWFCLLLEQIKEKGLDPEEIARKAVYECGLFHGADKLDRCADSEDLREFLKVFADENTRKVFEMEVVENTKDKLYIDFHYCPLVAAWKKLGMPDEALPLLCDIAMDGDRGICAKMGYDFKLGKVIAKGEGICEIRIERGRE